MIEDPELGGDVGDWVALALPPDAFVVSLGHLCNLGFYLWSTTKSHILFFNNLFIVCELYLILGYGKWQFQFHIQMGFETPHKMCF